MKKKLSYRDKLIELAYIYDVKEIKEYVKSRKNLTTGQLELILKKNKIIIPKDYKSNFFKRSTANLSCLLVQTPIEMFLFFAQFKKSIDPSKGVLFRSIFFA